MAFDPWPIDASSGSPSYSAQELRVQGVAALMAGAGVSLGARSGVRLSGSGTDLLVQAQASPNMTVKVNPGVIVVQNGVSAVHGAYTWALDTLTNLTVGAAHASLTRIDRILVRVRDAGIDTSGQRDGNVIVWPGTPGAGVPAMPTDATYSEIAQVTVPAAATNIGGGGGQGTIADTRVFTSALGGVIPCTSTTRPSATAVANGQRIYETDTKRFMWSDTVTWRMVAGQLLYSKRDTSSTFLSNQAPGTFLAAFTSATITLPNTGTGQAYEVDWAIPASNGGFTNGRFNSWLSIAVNGSGTYTGVAKSGPATTNAADTWSTRGWETYKASSGDLTVQLRISIISVGGNFDSFADGVNPLLLRMRSTGLLASEVS